MVDSFYFLCFGSGRNEYNSFWAGKGGAVRSLLFARKMYHPEDSVFSLTNSKNNGGCHFTKKVQKSPLYLSYILIQERLGILAARCALYITYSIRFEKNDILRQYNDKIIMYSDRFRYHLIISETWKKVQHSGNSIRISHDLLSPSPSLSQRLLYSFLLKPKHRK